MCWHVYRVLAERKHGVGWGVVVVVVGEGSVELLLFEKHVSGLHNATSTKMK